MKHGYEMRVFWSDEDGAYVAVAPELRGCSAHGRSAEEALKELGTAIGLWLETSRQLGWPVPKPAERGEGKLLVRMPKSLKHELAVEAKQEGVSLNQLVVSLLAGARGTLGASALRDAGARAYRASKMRSRAKRRS